MLDRDAAAQSRATWTAYALLTATAVFWGMNAVLGKVAVGNISPMMLVSARWLSVLLLILVFLRRDLIKDWPILKNHLVRLSLMGAAGFTCFNALFYLAAHGTTAINIGILQGSIPVFVMLGAYFIYHDRITALQFLGVLATVLGVVVAASGGSFALLMTLAFNHGDILMMGACLLYSSYAIALRKRPKASPIGIFAVMASAAFILSLPFLYLESIYGTIQWPTPTGWLVIALVAVFPSFLSQIFFIKGVDELGPGRAGVFANMVPIFASLFAVIFLGEVFALHHFLALSLVLAGIWISERFKSS